MPPERTSAPTYSSVRLASNTFLPDYRRFFYTRESYLVDWNGLDLQVSTSTGNEKTGFVATGLNGLLRITDQFNTQV